jgi:hypothetical protein
MLLTLRILVALVALSILMQATTMGIYLYGQDGALAVHRTGAMIAATLALLQAIVAVLYIVRGNGPRQLAITSVVMLVAIVAEMIIGFQHYTPLHMPLGVALFGGAVRMAAWATSAEARGRAKVTPSEPEEVSA